MKKNEFTLGEAIEAFLKKQGLTEKVMVEKAMNRWPEIMGKAISENTEQLWFREGRFFVKMKTPVWKAEITMAKSKIKEMLNKEMGKPLIEEVIVI